MSQRIFFENGRRLVRADGLSFNYSHDVVVVTPTDDGATVTVSLTAVGQDLAFPPDAGGERPARPVNSWPIVVSSPVWQLVTFSYPPPSGDESDATVQLTPPGPPTPPPSTPGALVVPVGYNLIDWRTVNVATRLSDGDVIGLTIGPDTAGPPDPLSFRLQLSAGPGAAWWKGVYLSQPSTPDGFLGYFPTDIMPDFELFTLVGREFVFGADTNITNSLSGPIPLDRVHALGQAILLQKAKFLGVHTPMYALDPRTMPIAGGSIVTINWIDQG